MCLFLILIYYSIVQLRVENLVKHKYLANYGQIAVLSTEIFLNPSKNFFFKFTLITMKYYPKFYHFKTEIHSFEYFSANSEEVNFLHHFHWNLTPNAPYERSTFLSWFNFREVPRGPIFFLMSPIFFQIGCVKKLVWLKAKKSPPPKKKIVRPERG